MDENNLYYDMTVPPIIHFPENLRRGFMFARQASQRSNHNKQMGAALEINRHTIRVGWNKDKTHPKYANGKECYSIHAEMDTIIRAGLRFDLSKPIMYVYREADGIPAMAKPCKYCMAHLIESKVKTIYYTIPREPWYERLEL